ncbi:MAG: LysE family translocator [Chloroflexota bacterium]|nr:LysE family translocator [Chloroflexota bacterium]
MSIEFLVTTLIVVVSPGIGVLYTLAAALSRGFRASVIAAFGCTLGIVPHVLVAIVGLSAFLHAGAIALQVLRYLGAAYLLYLAWEALRTHGSLKIETQVGTRSATRIVTTAILINILNPKLSIFFFAFLPQFINASDPDPTGQMVALSAVFMALTFLVFIGYGLLAAAARRQIIGRPRVLTWMRRAFAAAFVALAARLALSD